MKCPLMFAGDTSTGLEYGEAQCNCLKEECAWWSEDEDQCDPTGLLPTMREILIILQNHFN